MPVSIYYPVEEILMTLGEAEGVRARAAAAVTCGLRWLRESGFTLMDPHTDPTREAWRQFLLSRPEDERVPAAVLLTALGHTLLQERPCMSGGVCQYRIPALAPDRPEQACAVGVFMPEGTRTHSNNLIKRAPSTLTALRAGGLVVDEAVFGLLCAAQRVHDSVHARYDPVVHVDANGLSLLLHHAAVDCGVILKASVIKRMNLVPAHQRTLARRAIDWLAGTDRFTDDVVALRWAEALATGQEVVGPSDHPSAAA